MAQIYIELNKRKLLDGWFFQSVQGHGGEDEKQRSVLLTH